MKNTVTQPGRNGGRLLVGNPGNKGGGRKPSVWKELCQELASSDAARKRVEAVLSNPDHPAWLGTWKFVAEQGYGKAQASLEHSGDVGMKFYGGFDPETAGRAEE